MLKQILWTILTVVALFAGLQGTAVAKISEPDVAWIIESGSNGIPKSRIVRVVSEQFVVSGRRKMA